MNQFHPRCQLQGSLVALVTPMRGGAVDWVAFERLLEWHMEQGTDGIVVCGTTGEAATLSTEERRKLVTKARLKLRVEADSQGVAQESVEGKAYAREFTLTTGYGFYCSFTDPKLRGRPTEKGNYKVMSVGKIRLAPDVLVDVQIMGEGFSDEAYNQLLGAIEGMEFSPGRGR